MNGGYSKYYLEEAFWTKAVSFAKQAGKTALKNALILYYVSVDPSTPKWAKGVIATALGYFIFPLDAVPDLTPFVGYADDACAIAGALVAIATHISAEHIAKAKGKMDEWF